MLVLRARRRTSLQLHDFDLAKIKSKGGEPLLHTKAYYTVNEIPFH